MEVVIVESAEAGGVLVADAIESLLREKPDAVLGLATGSSPLPVYRELRRRDVSLARAKAFLLDEYVGLPPGHPQSYREVIRQELDVTVSAPDVHAADIAEACRRYEEAIAAAGGVDLQLLGIGSDGHIGFNEPGSSLGSRTRIKTLVEQTRQDNARFFDAAEDVPHHVVTQGVATILEARHVVLLALGAEKAAAVALAIEGPVTASVPASALQFHPHATAVLDEAASAGLERAGYYRETWAAKPSWQRL